MIRRLLIYLVMAALAAWCAITWPPVAAFLRWSLLTAGLCGLGAFLLHRQPIGIATVSGQLGGSMLQWGYKVGNGMLLPIALISWLVWAGLGAAVIALTVHRADGLLPWMILSWTIDGLALLYLIGATLSHSSRNKTVLLTPVALVLGMIVSSALFWRMGTVASQERALLIGGAPIPVLAAGYGAMLGAMLLGGRKGRGWQ